jgi:hypothetical protein
MRMLNFIEFFLIVKYFQTLLIISIFKVKLFQVNTDYNFNKSLKAIFKNLLVLQFFQLFNEVNNQNENFEVEKI